MEKNKNESRITFKQNNENEVDILQDDKIVGHIWSYLQNKGDYPFTYNEPSGYTEKNGIQICGFNNISKVWNCNMFEGHQDVVVDFNKNVIKKEIKIEMVYKKPTADTKCPNCKDGVPVLIKTEDIICHEHKVFRGTSYEYKCSKCETIFLYEEITLNC